MPYKLQLHGYVYLRKKCISLEMFCSRMFTRLQSTTNEDLSDCLHYGDRMHSIRSAYIRLVHYMITYSLKMIHVWYLARLRYLGVMMAI